MEDPNEKPIYKLAIARLNTAEMRAAVANSIGCPLYLVDGKQRRKIGTLRKCEFKQNNVAVGEFELTEATRKTLTEGKPTLSDDKSKFTGVETSIWTPPARYADTEAAQVAEKKDKS